MTENQALSYCGKRVQLTQKHIWSGEFGLADHAEAVRDTHGVIVYLDKDKSVKAVCVDCDQLEVLK